jgi:excisionase family DNA binding protein
VAVSLGWERFLESECVGLLPANDGVCRTTLANMRPSEVTMSRAKKTEAPKTDAWTEDLVRDLKPLVPADEAAAFLGVCRRTLDRWISDSVIEATHIGKKVVVTRSVLAAYVARRTGLSAAAK